jgi:hypothetical protein
MIHIKKYKLFEATMRDWENLIDLIQINIIEKYGFSNQDFEESCKYNYFEIKCLDNNSAKNIYKDIFSLEDRILKLTKFYLKCKKIESQYGGYTIRVNLSEFPQNDYIIRHFNLEKTDTDNIKVKMDGGKCTYEQALEIIEYLNKFWSCFYRTEIEYFKEAYQILNKSYKVEIIFSLPLFENERFRQVVCFQFKLKPKVKKVVGKYFPVFTVNTGYTESPYIAIRHGGYAWEYIECIKQKKLLEETQF